MNLFVKGTSRSKAAAAPAEDSASESQSENVAGEEDPQPSVFAETVEEPYDDLMNRLWDERDMYVYMIFLHAVD